MKGTQQIGRFLSDGSRLVCDVRVRTQLSQICGSILFFFLFFLFLYIILNFVRQAKKLSRYKRPVHPAVWSQTTSGNSPSLLPLAKNPLTLPDTVGSNELSGAMGRKLLENIHA